MLPQIEGRAPPAALKSRLGLRALANCPECPIRSVTICSVLDCRERVALESIVQRATFPPRAVVFLEGERASAVYTVTAGLVRLYRLLPSGHRQIVGFALPGDFLGLPADEHYGFSAEAAVATTACRFPRRAFLAFAESHSHFLRRLHDSAARAIDLAHDQMMQLGQRRADAKVAAFLLGMRGRWAPVHGASVHVPLPMGRQDIGDYLGLSIATVSRTLHRLDREQLIRIVPKGVRIFDLPRLEQLAGT